MFMLIVPIHLGRLCALVGLALSVLDFSAQVRIMFLQIFNRIIVIDKKLALCMRKKKGLLLWDELFSKCKNTNSIFRFRC